MSKSGLLRKMRSMRIVVVFMALILAYGAVIYSPQASTPMKVFSVDLGGITGAANTTSLAHNRFVLAAPFAPTKGVDENGELDIAELDNRFLYVVDSKKANNPPQAIELTAYNSKSVYFPTRLLFDPNSNIAYVRGTRFEEQDGEIMPIDVIGYVRMNLDDSDKPLFDSIVPVDIQGVSTKYTNEAPLDFALGLQGELLVFTNGASVFSYNINLGYLFEQSIVPSEEYGANSSISFLNVDKDTDIVSVCWNRRSVDKDSVVTTSSEISFYRVLADGRFELMKRIYSEQLPAGTILAPGSNIVIAFDPEKPASELALFATSDGSLYGVDLFGEEGEEALRQLHHFPELASSDPGAPSPLLINFDSSRRVVGIVSPGFTAQISRPTNGRRGRISRPTNIRIASATPVLAMAKLGRKNKVTSFTAFTEDFKDEYGLSNFVNGKDSEWLISTYSGNLYSVTLESDLQDSKLQLLGPVGSRVERIEYYGDRTSVVAINSFALGEDGAWISTPGSLVVAKLLDQTTQSTGEEVLQALMPTAAALGRPAPSIRRPCNIKR